MLCVPVHYFVLINCCEIYTDTEVKAIRTSWKVGLPLDKRKDIFHTKGLNVSTQIRITQDLHSGLSNRLQ